MKCLPYLRRKYILLVLLLLTSSMAVTGVNANPTKPYISVNPTQATIQAVGENVTIKVNVTNVENLYGWDIRLTYNKTLLEYVGRTVVGPNQVAPPDPDKYTLTDVSELGTLILGCAFSEVKDALPFNGSGVMEWITFKIIYVPPQGTAPPEYNEVSCPLALSRSSHVSMTQGELQWIGNHALTASTYTK